MKGKLRGTFVLVAVLIGIAAGSYFYFHPDEQSDRSLKLYGNVDIREIQLAFHGTGRIRVLHVEEGQAVREGALLAELDAARYEQAVNLARAKVSAQEEVLGRLLAGSRPEEIAAARAKVQAAEAAVRDAQQIHRRTRELAQSQYASQQKLDSAQAALKTAMAQLDAEQQALTLAVKGPRQEDIDAARAGLEADRAALALAQTELKDTRLYAPADGIIQNRILEPGDMAFPQTPVYTLALTDPIWVRAYVAEPDLGKIVPGMKAAVITDSFPGKVYEGWVGFISPTAEFTPKHVETTELRSKLVYQARIHVCNPENELRLGMPATVIISLDQPGPSSDRDPVDPCRAK